MSLKEKLTASRGESLTEALAAILIVALSAAALAAMIGASAKSGMVARELDKALYQALTQVETGGAPASGTVSVTIGEENAGLTYSIRAGSSPDGAVTLYSYQKGGAGA